MKRLFAFALTGTMLIACGDDNSSAATDDFSSSSEETTLSSSEGEIESSSSEAQGTKNSSSGSQEENSSSSSVNSSGSNSPVSADFGEGYTHAMAYRYNEATGIIYQGIESCNYHADSKTFAWEENARALDSNKITIVEDSMWIGPVEKFIADDPDMQDFYDTYDNRETLLLSSNHNGIYGKWKVTGCERTFGDTEIRCTPYIGGLNGIARTITITQDSVYNTTVVDTSNIIKKKLNIGRILGNYFGFEISDFHIDSLTEAQVIKVISNEEFSIGNQTFTGSDYAKFDQTGLNFYGTISSNDKTCTGLQQLGSISKEHCLEGNADFLLSARDKSEEPLYYKEGPVTGFNTDNLDEYYECTRSLVTEETKKILSAVAHN